MGGRGQSTSNKRGIACVHHPPCDHYDQMCPPSKRVSSNNMVETVTSGHEDKKSNVIADAVCSVCGLMFTPPLHMIDHDYTREVMGTECHECEKQRHNLMEKASSPNERGFEEEGSSFIFTIGATTDEWDISFQKELEVYLESHTCSIGTQTSEIELLLGGEECVGNGITDLKEKLMKEIQSKLEDYMNNQASVATQT